MFEQKKIPKKTVSQAVVGNLEENGLPAWARKHETHASSPLGEPAGEAEPQAALNLPALVKVDLDTPLESFLTGIVMLMGALIFFFFMGGIFGGKRTPPNPALLKNIPWALIVGAAAAFLRYYTDNYYIIDTRRKTIFYHFETAFYISLRPYLTASEVHAAGVTSRRCTSKHSQWHEYKILLVDKRGNVYDFSDYGREDCEEKNCRAREIALAMGCRHIPAENESRIQISRGSGGELLVFSTTDPEGVIGADFTFSNVLLVVALILVLILFIFAVYHLS